jgi:hypothetical protein
MYKIKHEKQTWISFSTKTPFSFLQLDANEDVRQKKTVWCLNHLFSVACYPLYTVQSIRKDG